jgi:SAM-dependent methyltransferase
VPTIVENLDRWEHHQWARGGDEWSPGRCPEGTLLLWQRTVLPRIHRFTPTQTILEIGPGFGRWTAFLRGLCERLILVDLSPRCLESCAARFAGDSRIEYHVNDGQSLDAIADGTVDFIFSFDSLVHAEADAIRAYVEQAARKLKPGGGAFIHHSNLGAFVSPRTGRIPGFIGPRNWRAESMSARQVQQYCDEAGLYCRSQELINWIGRGDRADRHRLQGRYVALTDCLTVFTNEPAAARPRVVANHAFVEEWRSAVWMVDVYAREAVASAPRKRDARVGAARRKLAAARELYRQHGVRGVMARAWQRGEEIVEFALSAVKSRLRGHAIRWFSRRSLA